MSVGNKNTPSMHRPRRRNVTACIVGKKGHIHRNPPPPPKKKEEKEKKGGGGGGGVNPRDITENTEEDSE